MIEALILGIVQGLTEFIPVSSSGHLVLLHDLFNMDAHGLAFDVALHIGTLLAVILYFRKDIKSIVTGVLKRQKRQQQLALLLALATLPAAFFGLIFQDVVESTLRSPWVVVLMLVMFGLFMVAAERQAELFKHKQKAESMTKKQSIIVGFLQACALIPGVSRSGATISGGLLLGLDRVAATRFSFLLAIPIILGAAVKVLISDGVITEVQTHISIFAVGMLAAFVSGMIAIQFLLRFVAKYSIRTFAYYRFVVAGIITVLLLIRG